jgi:hypothetical protein
MPRLAVVCRRAFWAALAMAFLLAPCAEASPVSSAAPAVAGSAAPARVAAQHHHAISDDAPADDTSEGRSDFSQVHESAVTSEALVAAEPAYLTIAVWHADATLVRSLSSAPSAPRPPPALRLA